MMRARKIYENIEFQRGIGTMDALGLGVDPKDKEAFVPLIMSKLPEILGTEGIPKDIFDDPFKGLIRPKYATKIFAWIRKYIKRRNPGAFGPEDFVGEYLGYRILGEIQHRIMNKGKVLGESEKFRRGEDPKRVMGLGPDPKDPKVFIPFLIKSLPGILGANEIPKDIIASWGESVFTNQKYTSNILCWIDEYIKTRLGLNPKLSTQKDLLGYSPLEFMTAELKSLGYKTNLGEIQESEHFIRGEDPKKTMGIGLHPQNKEAYIPHLLNELPNIIGGDVLRDHQHILDGLPVDLFLPRYITPIIIRIVRDLGLDSKKSFRDDYVQKILEYPTYSLSLVNDLLGYHSIKALQDALEDRREKQAQLSERAYFVRGGDDKTIRRRMGIGLHPKNKETYIPHLLNELPKIIGGDIRKTHKHILDGLPENIWHARYMVPIMIRIILDLGSDARKSFYDDFARTTIEYPTYSLNMLKDLLEYNPIKALEDALEDRRGKQAQLSERAHFVRGGDDKTIRRRMGLGFPQPGSFLFVTKQLLLARWGQIYLVTNRWLDASIFLLPSMVIQVIDDIKSDPSGLAIPVVAYREYKEGLAERDPTGIGGIIMHLPEETFDTHFERLTDETLPKLQGMAKVLKRKDKRVYETIKFQRGRDPGKTMGLGVDMRDQNTYITYLIDKLPEILGLSNIPSDIINHSKKYIRPRYIGAIDRFLREEAFHYGITPKEEEGWDFFSEDLGYNVWQELHYALREMGYEDYDQS